MKKGSSLPSKAGQQASSTATANNSTPQQQGASQAKQPGSSAFIIIPIGLLLHLFPPSL